MIGPVTAGTGAGSVSITGSPTLVVVGSIGAASTIALTGGTLDFGTGALVAAPTIDLSAGPGGIALTGNASVGQALGLIDMTSAGTVTEAATSVLTAATLDSTLGVSAGVSLPGTANAIGGLGNFAVTGGGNGFALDDGAALIVAGTVTAPGQVYLQTTNAGGIAIAAGGSIGAGSLASFQAAAFANSGAVTAGTFEWAPVIVGSTQTLGPLSGIPHDVRIGAVTLPGAGSATTTAGSIVVGGNFGTGATILELDSLGGINETGGALKAAALTGNANGTVSLGNVNTIAGLGPFTVTGSAPFTLNDTGEVGNLAIGGSLAASSITISDAGAITVANTISAPTGKVQLTSGGGGIALNAGALLDGGIVDLDGTGGITETSGIIDATTLLSSGGVTGNVALGGLNNVATLAGFVVTGGGFSLFDGGSLAGIAVTGPVTANTGASNVTIDGALGSIMVSGSVGAGGTVLLDGSAPSVGVVLNGGAMVTGATIDVNGGGVGIAMNGNASVGNSGAIVDLTTTGGGVAEAATAVIAAGTLQSTGGIGGTVDLPGTGNAIASVGSLAVAGGTFSVIDTGNLGVGGKLAASTITIDDGAGSLTVSNSLIATSAISLTAGNIAIPGLVSDGGTGTTALFANLGAISETGTLIAGTLSGSAATAATLTGASATTNQVATVASFSAAGFTLDDGKSLNVTGALSGGPSATVLDTGTLTIAAGGTVTAAAIGLTAGNLAIPGLVTDGGAGTTSLVANTGTIGETGTLVSGTLSGSAVGAANLAGTTAVTNHVAALGNFTAGAFTLNDGSPLIVAGTLSAAPSATILDSGNLTVSGSIVSTNSVNLTASSIAISGFLGDSFGTTTLLANAGSIDETGTLVVGTLTGSATGAANFSGAAPGTNTIVHLGSFSASPFTLDDGIVLSVPGPVVSGSSITITDEGFLADVPSLSVTGTIAAPAVSLTADSMAIAGEVTDGGAGTVALIATSGTIGETGTLIAGTLTGSSTGGTSLTGATATTNKVAVLGNFLAPGFTLDDGAGLTVTGALIGGPSATVLDQGTLTVAPGGTVSATAVSLTAGNIDIAGLVTDGGAGTTNLVAKLGSISEPGTLIAGTLSGSAAAAAAFSGATPTINQVGTVSHFSATGFTLDDGTGSDRKRQPDRRPERHGIGQWLTDDRRRRHAIRRGNRIDRAQHRHRRLRDRQRRRHRQPGRRRRHDHGDRHAGLRHADRQFDRCHEPGRANPDNQPDRRAWQLLGDRLCAERWHRPRGERHAERWPGREHCR